MLKARGKDEDGTPLMLIGLSGENVTRLVAGESIAFDMAEMGLPPCHVLITYGRTDQDIMVELMGGGASAGD